MFKTSHSVKTLAEPEDVWALVKDPGKWRTCLLGVQEVQLHGSLGTGALGRMILYNGTIHEIQIQKFVPGYLELVVKLKYGVRMLLTIDINELPMWSQIKMEGKFFGAMSFMHIGGWVKNLRTGLAPTVRLLGELSQDAPY